MYCPIILPFVLQCLMNVEYIIRSQICYIEMPLMIPNIIGSTVSDEWKVEDMTAYSLIEQCTNLPCCNTVTCEMADVRNWPHTSV